uniref:BHLH domain-containing protein n=1 Tax=Fagus sylvatica TaxID=28930 RepID=A0A2N9EPK3_FAGSY
MVLLRQLERDMQQFQRYYKSGTCTIQNSLARGLTSTNTINHKFSFSKPKSKFESKQLAAKKHSEAERRRRMRINGQYATLRDVLPNLVKMDKATVLAETVRQVRELRKTVSDLEAVCRGSSSTKDCVFPGEANRLSLENCDNHQGLVKVTFSCEDRPGLISAVARTLRSMKGRVVKFEMVTLGGRTKNVLWVRGLSGGNEGIVMLRRALKVVIDRPILPGFSKKSYLT